MKKLKQDTKALFLLWFLCLVSCLFIFRHFLFGDAFVVFKDVGADTLQQYIMQYSSIINAIKEGNLSLWDFTNGLGTSVYALNLFHPLLFLLYIVGAILSPRQIPYLLVFFQIGQIFLAGTVFFCYTKEFTISNRSRVLAAYLYAFNGYLLVWGQHYQFGLYAILFPLLLLLAERALKKKTFSLPLALGVCLTVLSSVYMAYMTLLGLGFYLLFRIFSSQEPFRKQVILFLKNCGSILLGLGMVMVIFLPSASYLFHISSRIKQDSFITRILANFGLYDWNFYKTAFFRLFSSNLCGISENYTGRVNYYEDPVLFFGICSILLLFQYLFTIHRQKNPRKQKIAQYLAFALVCFFVLTPFGSMIFNAFVSPFSRHTFLIMPFIALVSAFTLDQILQKKQFSYMGLGLSLLLFAILYGTNKGTEQTSSLLLCFLGVLMAAILFLLWQKKWKFSPTLLLTGLLLLVMTNMIYDSYQDYNGRAVLTKSDTAYFEELYGEDVTSALAYLRETDDTFYRVEKDYESGSYCMDALAQNYFGVSTYNSTPNKHIQTFVHKFWPALKRMTPSMYSYRQTVYDADIASLLHIKYLLSHNPSLDVDGFVLLKQFGNVYIYQNQNTQSLGKFYTRTTTCEDLPDNLSAYNTGRLLRDILVLPEETEIRDKTIDFSDYALEPLPYTLKKQYFKHSDSLIIPIDQETLADWDEVYLSVTIKLSQDGILAIRLNDSYCRYVSCKKNKGTKIRLRIPKSCSEITFFSTAGSIKGTVKNFTFYGAASAPASNQEDITFSSPDKDTLVTGTIDSNEDGYLMVSIPYEDGWHAYIDGKETEILQADYGFQALSVTAGHHEITFRYQAPGFIPGTILSIFFTGIFLVILLFQLRKTSKQQQTK